MGLFDLYKDQLENFKWIPIVSFSTTILLASCGMLPLTFVILSEILPKKVISGQNQIQMRITNNNDCYFQCIFRSKILSLFWLWK